MSYTQPARETTKRGNRVLAIVFRLALLLYSPAAHAQCIDYEDHLHCVGGVETPDEVLAALDGAG